MTTKTIRQRPRTKADYGGCACGVLKPLPDSASVKVGGVQAPGGGGKTMWRGFWGVLSCIAFVYIVQGNWNQRKLCAADGFLLSFSSPLSGILLMYFIYAKKEILFNENEIIKVDYGFFVALESSQLGNDIITVANKEFPISGARTLI